MFLLLAINIGFSALRENRDGTPVFHAAFATRRIARNRRLVTAIRLVVQEDGRFG